MLSFYQRKKNDPKWMEKRNEYKRAYYKRNKLQKREERLKFNYGISLEDYDQMLKDQHGLCAICSQKETYRTNDRKRTCVLAVDHDHKTNKVRGLICASCNLGIGIFKENTNTLAKAIKYLEKYNLKTISE